jgi:D-glycero-alpha-D-manno-heptose 1-phosphate guanylyltransferase
MKAIVLAGGLGTRLRGRIVDLPKPMAPVAGRPFLEYVLDRLVLAGIDSITLSVGYRAEVIQEHFKDSYKGVPVQYTFEPEPLGTGGALALAVHGMDTEEPMLALNGDTLLRLNLHKLIRWYAQAPEALAMVLRQVPDAGRYGAIKLDSGRVIGFEERGLPAPGLINGGVYIMQPRLFEDLGLSGRFSFEVDVLQKHCVHLRPRAYITDAYFIDIGIPEDLDRAGLELPKLA